MQGIHFYKFLVLCFALAGVACVAVNFILKRFAPRVGTPPRVTIFTLISVIAVVIGYFYWLTFLVQWD